MKPHDICKILQLCNVYFRVLIYLKREHRAKFVPKSITFKTYRHTQTMTKESPPPNSGNCDCKYYVLWLFCTIYSLVNSGSGLILWCQIAFSDSKLDGVVLVNLKNYKQLLLPR